MCTLSPLSVLTKATRSQHHLLVKGTKIEKLLDGTSSCVGVRGVSTSVKQLRPSKSIKQSSTFETYNSAPCPCARGAAGRQRLKIPKANEIKAKKRPSEWLPNPRPTPSVNRTRVHNDGHDGDHVTTHVFIMQRARRLLRPEEVTHSSPEQKEK